MNTKRLKLFGVIALMVAFTVTMAACDLGDDDEVANIQSVAELDEVTVDYGTSVEDAMDELADTVEVTFTDDGTADADISWRENEDYDGEDPDTYTFEGSATADYDTETFTDIEVEQDVVVAEEDPDDDDDEDEDEDKDEVDIRETDNDLEYDLYTLAQDGAREFDVYYDKVSEGDVDAATVKLVFLEDGTEVTDRVVSEEQPLLEGEETHIATMAPELDSGSYTAKVVIDTNDDGEFDFKQEFSLKVGAVGAEGIFETFTGVNDALDEGNLITLYEDVAKDVEIERADAELDLNGFEVKDVDVGEDAANTVLREGVIDGDLTVKFDGYVEANGITINEDLVYRGSDGEVLNNAYVEGDYEINGEVVYNPAPVENAGELANELMNETEEIVFHDDITWTNEHAVPVDYSKVDHDLTLYLGPHTFTLDDQDLEIFGTCTEAFVKSGEDGGIVGATGGENIVIGEDDEDEPKATFMGADGNDLHMEDVEKIEVEELSKLTLSDVYFEEGDYSRVEFDVVSNHEDAADDAENGALNIANTVTADDVELAFVGDGVAEDWQNIDVEEDGYYGIIQLADEVAGENVTEGVIEGIGTGKVFVETPGYHFRGLDVEEVLTLDIGVELDIDIGDTAEDEDNVILANVELLDLVEMMEEENVLVDDILNESVVINGGSHVEEGEFLGADGTDDSDYIVGVNRSYFEEGVDTTTNFDYITMRQHAFKIGYDADDGHPDHDATVNISEHTFNNRMFVEFPETLTATGDVYVGSGSTVEFGNEKYNDAGTFTGGATVHGPGDVLYTEPYTVSGPSWFTFDVDQYVESDVTFEDLELLQKVYIDADNTVEVTGDLLGEEDVYDQGKFIGEGPGDSTVETTVSTNVLEEINMQELDFNVEANADYKSSAFDEDVVVDIVDNVTLEVVDGLHIVGDEVYVEGEGTFTGDWVDDDQGSHPVNFSNSEELNVEGNTYFTFRNEIDLHSHVNMSRVEFNTINYEEDVTLYADGNLKAWEREADDVLGLVDGSDQDHTRLETCADEKERIDLINLTFRDLEQLELPDQADTAIVNKHGETMWLNDAGLDVRFDTAQETEFLIEEDTSLMIGAEEDLEEDYDYLDNTRVRVRDETLILAGDGAVRGMGEEPEFFQDGDGIVKLTDATDYAVNGVNVPDSDIKSNLILHGRQDDLIFDLVVEVGNELTNDEPETRLGDVLFKDWVISQDLDEATFRVIGNKEAKFEKGLNIDDADHFNLFTGVGDIPGVPAAAEVDPDDYRGTVLGVEDDVEIKGEAELALGDMLKVENLTLHHTLEDVEIDDNTVVNDAKGGRLTLADLVIENIGDNDLDDVIDFEDWDVHLDGDIELARDRDTDDGFTALEFNSSNEHEAALYGHGNEIWGDGGVKFETSGERQVDADDVTFDIRETSFPYEVQITGDDELAIFTDVDWTSQTTVYVEDENILRFKGDNVNDGGLRVWRDDDEDGVERKYNLEYEDHIDYYDI